MAGLGFSELVKRKNLEVLLQKIIENKPFKIINDPWARSIYGLDVKIAKQPKLIANLNMMVANQNQGKTISPADLNAKYLPSPNDKEEIYANLFNKGEKDLYSIKLPLETPIIKTRKEIEDELRKTISSPEKLEKSLQKLKNLNLIEDGKYRIDSIHTGKLLKTAEFGGKESEHSLTKENLVFKNLNELLQKATQDGKAPITINVIDSFNKQIMLLQNVVRAEKTPGSANKAISDFEIKNSKNETIAFISHKWGNEPTDFGQYSGVSEKNRSKIFSHPETQAFANSLKEWLYYISNLEGNGEIQKYIEATRKNDPSATRSTGWWKDSVQQVGNRIIYIFPPGITIAKLISDPTLKRMAMFGEDVVDSEGNVTKQKGKNAVDFLAQGNFSLDPREDGTWDLKATKLISSSEDMGNIEKKYEPVFVARYEGKKANLGIKGCRVSIYAREGRNVKLFLVKEQENS